MWNGGALRRSGFQNQGLTEREQRKNIWIIEAIGERSGRGKAVNHLVAELFFFLVLIGAMRVLALTLRDNLAEIAAALGMPATDVRPVASSRRAPAPLRQVRAAA
jgi:hypothetical protein